MDKAMRLFIAIDPPESALQQIEPMLKSLPGGKAVPLEQIHLTLKFIGEVGAEPAEAIQAALAQIRGEPFSLTLKGTGCFPSQNRPRVLWVGVQHTPSLMRLAEKIETTLIPFGVPEEKRPFHPHLTLARFKRTNAQAVKDFLAKNLAFQSRAFDVNEFHLYSSVLTPQGAIHHKELSVSLSS
jgi:2'-5' RNA ligase